MPKHSDGLRKNLFKTIIVPSIVILVTLGLILLVLSINPGGESKDPNLIIESSFQFFGTFFLSTVIILIVLYYFRDYLVTFLLILLNVVGILNQCNFCKNLRGASHPFLVNGFCANCKTHMCSKCFNLEKNANKKKSGCPVCGGTTLKRNKKLGYRLYFPDKLKNLPEKIKRFLNNKIKRSDIIANKEETKSES